MQASAQFSRAADQVPGARSFVRDTLTTWGVTTRLNDLVLMTSELFTNAVLHGDGAVDVSVCLPPGRVRVEVADDGTFGPSVSSRDVPTDQVTGRGLVIVDLLADDWGGGQGTDGRTRVWLEVARDG